MESGAIHWHMGNLSLRDKNGKPRSAVAKAAYNAGQDLWFEREKRMTTFGTRTDIFHQEILAPEDAPDWCYDRAELWNTVEQTARRVDARLVKNIQAAITRGIPPEQWVQMIKDYVAPFIELGHVVDFAIHEDGFSENPHVHIMLTVRAFTENGFGKKFGHIDERGFLKASRARWATVTNTYLKANGLKTKVDHRSYAAQGLEKTPTRHRGPNKRERALKHKQRANARLFKENIMSERDNKPKVLAPEPHTSSYEDEIPAGDIENPNKKYWFEEDLPHKEAKEPDFADIITDEDLRNQTGLTVQTNAERQLLLAVRDAPAEVQNLVENEIIFQQQQRQDLQNQRQRLNSLADFLTAEQQVLLDDTLEEQRKHYNEHPFPEAGPYYDPYSSRELHEARQKQQEEYEKDETDYRYER